MLYSPSAATLSSSLEIDGEFWPRTAGVFKFLRILLSVCDVGFFPAFKWVISYNFSDYWQTYNRFSPVFFSSL